MDIQWQCLLPTNSFHDVNEPKHLDWAQQRQSSCQLKTTHDLAVAWSVSSELLPNLTRFHTYRIRGVVKQKNTEIRRFY